MNRLLCLSATLALLCAAGCTRSGERAMRRVTIKVGGHAVLAEVAEKEEDKERGLMFRDTMGEDEGMIFVYDRPQTLYFYMKNTRIPLSIAFIDSNGVILRIADMQPHDLRTHSSVMPAQYALEMNQGWFAKKGIEPGAKVEWPNGL
ncbi:MAG TPA: DUF192 domain-containing protein [Candidatus Brocadiia bacterium]|nr:DUF192 domain-containing protein [Candidatus Brocadiia bacterium]